MAAEEKRVYMLTSKGNAELTAGKSSLNAADLGLLVLVDGLLSVEEIARRVPGQPPAADVAKALKALSRGGYVADPDGTAAIDVKAFFKDIDSSVQSLQANGFFVRIARRAEAPAKRPPGKGLRLLSLERLERMNRRAMMLAFPLLTAGLLVGIGLIWHNRDTLSAWETPKFVSTLVLWLVFAILLYLRHSAHVAGRQLALLTIVAFGLMLFSLVTVHPLAEGGVPR